MLLSLSLLFLLACIFGYMQSLALKDAQDLLNKQGLELSLVRTQYKHNLTRLLELEKGNQQKDVEIHSLQNEIENLKVDLDCSQDLQIDEDKFQEIIESHVLNILSSIDLHQAYENACSYHDLELSIEDLVK